MSTASFENVIGGDLLLPNANASGAEMVQWGPDYGDEGPTVEARIGAVALELTTPVSVEARLGRVQLELTTGVSVTATVPRFTLDVTALAGANAQAEEDVTGGGWTNEANCTGAPDGNNANFAGDLVNPKTGRLVLSYEDFTTLKDNGFTLTLVQVRYYVRSTGTLLNNGDLRLEWRKVSGGAWTTLETVTDNIDNLAAGSPRVFDITASIANWDDIAAFQAGVRGATDAAENLVAYDCNAVELRILATKSVTL